VGWQFLKFQFGFSVRTGAGYPLPVVIYTLNNLLHLVSENKEILTQKNLNRNLTESRDSGGTLGFQGGKIFVGIVDNLKTQQNFRNTLYFQRPCFSGILKGNSLDIRNLLNQNDSLPIRA
jgi:hypothetical protein